MNISPISFHGLINIIGKDPKSNISVNSNTISTINSSKYIDADKDNDSNEPVSVKEASVLNLTNGTRIKVFAPMDKVVEAYKQSSDKDVELKSEYNPLIKVGICNLI